MPSSPKHGKKPPLDHAPDPLAVSLFVTTAPRSEWATRYLLLRRMSSKMPHLQGRRLASYSGGALTLDFLKATYHALRDARARRILGARALRRPAQPSHATPPLHYDPELLNAIWNTLTPTQQTIVLSLLTPHGTHALIRGRFTRPLAPPPTAKAQATRDLATLRSLFAPCLDT